MLLRRSEERGTTQTSWLDSKHTFSFADYHDPKWNRFKSLRVINEDFIAPGGGFATHGHQDMEILTLVIEGAIAHKDSMNNAEVIHPYQLQKMSAGTGVLHSEFNHYNDRKGHFLQIWIMPNKKGIEPNYATFDLKNLEASNKGYLVASPLEDDKVIHLHQNVKVYFYRMKSNDEVVLPEATSMWIQVIKGDLETTNSLSLHPGDGLGVNKNETNDFFLQARYDKTATEFLIFAFQES